MVKKNGLALLAYLFGFLSGIIIFLISEKKDRFVRFHAVQSIFFNVAVWLIWGVFFLFPPVQWAITVIAAILWLFLMYKAYQGEKFKLFVLGDWAEDVVK